MPSKTKILEDKEVKALEEQYDPEKQVELQKLLQEINPVKWHHQWAWSPRKQEINGMIQMCLVWGALVYLLMPFIPKPSWAPPIVIAFVVVILVIWNVATKWQAITAAGFRWLSAIFYMSGKPDAGLQQLRVWYPVVRREKSKDLTPVSMQQIRLLLNEWSQDLAERIAKQRNQLRGLGVPIPEPLPVTQNRDANPVGYMLTHPKPRPTLTWYLIKYLTPWWPVVVIVGSIALVVGILCIPLFAVLNLPLLAGGILAVIAAIFMRTLKRRTQQKYQVTKK